METGCREVEEAQEYLEGVASEIVGWIGDTRKVGGDYVTDVRVVVKTETMAIKAGRHFEPPFGWAG